MKQESRIDVLYLFAITASIALSLWINLREVFINPDAVCYLQSAAMVGKAGLNAAMHFCPQSIWPFYSALIFWFSKASHFSLTACAYILNGVFSAISVVSFIAIVKELGGSRRVLWLAALVILLAHDFNAVRQYIDRDHGYWAFYLVSMVCLLRYFRQPTWFYGLAFGVSLSVATLFRIEGALFLLSLPWLTWFVSHHSWRQRIVDFLTLNTLAILGCLAVGVWLMTHPEHSISQLGRLAELGHQLQSGASIMMSRMADMKMGLAQHVLTPDSVKQAGPVLVIMFIGWYMASVIASLSVIYTLLVIYAWVKKALTLSSDAAMVVGGYIGINIIITVGFLVEHTFLSKRYLIALSLVLMLWVPFALELLVKAANHVKGRMVLALVVLMMVVTAVGGIYHDVHSKNYMLDASVWVQKNIPESANVYMNDLQLMYYSKHFGDAIYQKFEVYRDIQSVMNERWKTFDYIVLRMDRKNNDPFAEWIKETKLKPIQILVNARGDQVAIYRVK